MNGLQKGIGGAVGACLCAVTIALVVAQDRHERALIVSGHCRAVAEALYTPPPMAQTSCSGSAQATFCSTYYVQADPYFRTLWRCTVPEQAGATSEFWRRSSGEAHQ